MPFFLKSLTYASHELAGLKSGLRKVITSNVLFIRVPSSHELNEPPNVFIKIKKRERPLSHFSKSEKMWDPCTFIYDFMKYYSLAYQLDKRYPLVP